MAAVNKLRAGLNDVAIEDVKYEDDFYLLQWLKAHKMDVKRTEAAIRANVEWRRESDIDVLAEEDFPRDLAEKLPVHLNGVSKGGMPVLSLRAADVDFEEVIRKFGRERIVRYWAQIFVKMEKIMIAHNQKNNVNTEKLTAGCTTGFMVVVDGRDYLLRHILSIKLVHICAEIAYMYKAHFPSIASQGIFITSNRFYELVVKVLRPILDCPSLTLEIYNSNQESWKKSIFGRVDPTQLRIGLASNEENTTGVY